MKLSNVDFTIFLLGLCYDQCSRMINPNLQLQLRKCDFIRLARKAKLIDKSERAIYKNLEILQNKNYINYSNSRISLTRKGVKKFEIIDKKVRPFINLSNSLNSVDISKLLKSQLFFRS